MQEVIDKSKNNEEEEKIVLKNKLNITNSVEQAHIEEKVTKKKAMESFEEDTLNIFEVGTFKDLSAIHKYLFEDIYDFVGLIRNVNIVKGNFCFAPVLYLSSALKKMDQMLQSTFDEIIEKCFDR